MVFVTRKFPPSVGGMEALSAGIWRSLRASSEGPVLIAHGGRNRGLVAWFPRALFRLAFRLRREGAPSVLTGDALTWAVMEPVTRWSGVPAATLVMGLDMTYAGRCYRAFVLPALRRAPRVIAISSASAQQAAAVGVRPDRISVLKLGLPVPDRSDRPRQRASVIDALGLRPGDFVILTLGRLVRRKGVSWFVESVLPQLPGHVHYVVAGEGPERASILAASERHGLKGRVHLLGRVDEEVRELLLAGADLFVQPNVPVAGDMEGFGLVVVEAALRGTPVVASDLEGIRDAVAEGETGDLVPAGDAEGWQRTIAELVRDPEATAATGARYAARAARLYSEEEMGVALRRLLAR